MFISPSGCSHGRAANVAQSATGAPTPLGVSIPPPNLPDVTSHGRAAYVAQSATGAPTSLGESIPPPNLPVVNPHGRALILLRSPSLALDLAPHRARPLLTSHSPR